MSAAELDALVNFRGVEPSSSAEDAAGDAPTQPLERLRPTAPSGVAGPTAGPTAPSRRRPSSHADGPLPSAPKPQAGRLQRPRSMQARAVSRRGVAGAATPRTAASARASVRSQRAAHRRAAAAVAAVAPVASSARQGGSNAEDPALELPSAPPPSLPDAVATVGRMAGRVHAETMPSWSGQTSPEAPDLSAMGVGAHDALTQVAPTEEAITLDAAPPADEEAP